MKRLSKGFWIALIAAVAAICGYIFYGPCNGITQGIRMRAIDRYRETLAPRLIRDPRFARATLETYTGGACGCLLVRGNVETDDDLLALRTFIAGDNPAMEVFYVVTVGDNPFPTQQWDRR